MALSKRIYLSSLLGVFLEYFDYTLYGFSAPYISASFFPQEKPAIALIFTWTIFALGFLLRPLGAVIFGHLADKIGRSTVLTFSITFMSLSTLAMGIIPPYQTIGVAAPLLLVTCRVFQGIAVSTEYSGAGTYLLEFKKKRQGLFSGIITSATGLGVFGASLLALLFNSIHVDLPFLANWRWPFIVAGIGVGILGIYLRRNLTETPSFMEAKEQNKLVNFPFIKVLKNHKLNLLRAIIISGYTGISIILLEVYLPSYLQIYLHIKKETALQLSTFLALLEAFFAIMWGGISDKKGQKAVMLTAAIMMIVGIFPLLALFRTPHPALWFVSAAFLALTVGAVDGPLSAFLNNCFTTEVRYTGVSVSYNIGIALIGGVSPGLIEFLQNQLGTPSILPWYLLIGAVTILIAYPKGKNTTTQRSYKPNSSRS